MRHIRPYRPGDLAGVSAVCLRTGHAGGDARPFYRDPDLLPDVFARPYLVREPELATVVDDGGATVGYVLGTADTAGFVRWFRDVWLPPLAARHPAPPVAPLSARDGARPPAPDGVGESGVGESGTGEDWDAVMTRALHHPERMLRPELAGHPGHLHINLLPGYQRQGLGSRLMRAFLDALRVRRVPAVHLAYAKVNIPARQFYRRMGFAPVTVDDPDPVRYVGHSTT